VYTGQIDSRWRIDSFSSLTQGVGASPAPVLDTNPASTPDSPIIDDQEPWHSFPKGALAGQFLHDQLQWLAEENFALHTRADLQERLLRQAQAAGFVEHAPNVVLWLTQVVSTKIPVLDANLSQLKNHQVEMEFWLPTQIDTRHINTLCCQHLLNAHPRAPLADKPLQGMLMGFIDFIFEWQGRYWVLDYKSNHLGAQSDNYHQDALEAAMAQHRYDVQAALYMQALHRLLQARLGPSYHPKKHLGGAIYFFLRGINHPQRGCYVVSADGGWLDALL
jgi:exodeoxyribonuclease V beta subunit